VLSVRFSLAAHGRWPTAAAAVMCTLVLVLVLVLPAAAGASRAAASKSSSHRAACKAASHHGARRAASNACKAKKSTRLRPKKSVNTESKPAKNAGAPVSTSSAASEASGEHPAESQLPGTPLEAVSPVETKTPPVGKEPPVKPIPVETEAPPVAPIPVETKTPPVEEKGLETGPPFRFFAPTSFWNEPVPANAAIDPSSAAIVHQFDEEVFASESPTSGPTINTVRWSVPVYTVPANEPVVRVKLREGSPSLQAAWDAVPLPSNARPAAGTDKHLVVWQPSSDRLWEFWRLENGSAGWEATWGGAMQNVSSNPGVYGPEAWPGASSLWGGSASSLSLAGGLITLEDLAVGKINHALNLSIPNVREGAYSSPAQRDDGSSTSPLALPEGAHLRLEPGLDLAALHLPHVTLLIAEAAQRYGVFIRSQGGSVAFEAQDPTPTGTEPYAGRGGYFEGKTAPQLLASFPWSHLQLLKMELHNF
jgi:hypothetical protein